MDRCGAGCGAEAEAEAKAGARAGDGQTRKPETGRHLRRAPQPREPESYRLWLICKQWVTLLLGPTTARVWGCAVRLRGSGVPLGGGPG